MMCSCSSSGCVNSSVYTVMYHLLAKFSCLILLRVQSVRNKQTYVNPDPFFSFLSGKQGVSLKDSNTVQ